MQAKADAGYFVAAAGRVFAPREVQAIHATMLAAYRWQYIASGVQEPRFLDVLGSMIDAAQWRAHQRGARTDRRRQHAVTFRPGGRAVVIRGLR